MQRSENFAIDTRYDLRLLPTCIYIYIIYIYVCVDIYIYIYIYTHTYTYRFIYQC